MKGSNSLNKQESERRTSSTDRTKMRKKQLTEQTKVREKD